MDNSIIKASMQQLSDMFSSGQDELSELETQAIANLSSLLKQEDSPFKSDPALALEACATLTKARQGLVESKRRALDSLIKAAQAVAQRAETPEVPSNQVDRPEIAKASEESLF